MKLVFRTLISTIMFIGSLSLAYAKPDSLTFKNGDVMIGEVKAMDKGVLHFETDYSDSDFKIEWKKVLRITTSTKFMITMSDGTKYYSTITAVNDSVSVVNTKSGLQEEVITQDIVFLSVVEDKVLDRFDAEISLGLDIAKANNLKNLSTRSNFRYQEEKWSADLSCNWLHSAQDSIEDIQRTELESNLRLVLPHQMYIITSVSGLSNSEQKINVRLNLQLGLGRYLIKTNKAYWGAKIGANRNLENYYGDTPDRQSWEALLGTELNLYDIGDLSLITTIVAYQGITESGRFRADGNFDLKYDLPLDFFIKIGVSANYDNRPAEGAEETDYFFKTGFGWEW